MHTAKAMIASYARQATIKKLNGLALSRRENWQPTPNPAGRFYVEIAMNNNGEPEEVQKSEEKTEH